VKESNLLRGSLGACALLVGSLGLTLGGCADRTQIRDEYGQSVRAFYVAQRVHDDAALESPTGLDSEEAALIQQQYRAGMGGGADAPKSQQVLVLEPPKDQ